jgi:nucleotide-binding universal stress UspA family protein
MASSKIYLVPVDFSKGSEIALEQAVKMVGKTRGTLLLLHVITATFVYPTAVGFGNIFEGLERAARESMGKLIRRHRLDRVRHRSIIIRAADPAHAIAAQAKKSGASMIVMGSHGRTGLHRLMVGSVAERTLRYAKCPVLVVKR